MENGLKVVKEIQGVKEKNSRVAAFFDLDGTLVPLPSLEKRFYRTLRYRHEISLPNFFLWLGEAFRLLPNGIRAAAHANKMYLRGVQSLDFSGDLTSLSVTGVEARENRSGQASGDPSQPRASQAEGQASATPPKRPGRNPRCPVPRFFKEAADRAALHVQQGHALVIVSGTLEPLANGAARELEAELAARGCPAKIRICATRLEEVNGKWTGKILGEAMFGEAKARAVKQLAQKMQLDLSQCCAYGDSTNDQAMLASVGNPIAVNPSRPLARIGRRRGWIAVRWKEDKDLAPGAQSSRRAQRKTFRRAEQRA